jgi:hypothetical protein
MTSEAREESTNMQRRRPLEQEPWVLLWNIRMSAQQSPGQLDCKVLHEKFIVMLKLNSR